MKLPVSVFIGWRYANSRKGSHFIAFINFFSITGIALGLAALILVSSVMNGFEGQLKQRILGLLPHFIVNTTHAELPQSIADDEMVKGVIPFAELEAAVQSTSGLKPVIVQGVEARSYDQYASMSEHLLLGNLSRLQPGEFGIVIGRSLAMSLDIQVGEPVRIMTAEGSRYTLLGRIPSQRKFKVVGIFEMGSELDSSVVLMNIADLARLLRKPQSEIEQSRLFLQDPFDYMNMRTQLDKAGFQYHDWRERQGPLFDAVKMEKNMMLLMLLLIVAVAAFNIVSALVMVVTEKQGDIAILQTQGMSRTSVLMIFLVNGLSNGIKGTLIGSAIGLILAFNINEILLMLGVPMHLYLPEARLPILVQNQQVTAMIALSLLLCFSASLYPAYRASKVKPANALRYE
ncbi:lipoprotein-releasing ABC transporter permease subunit [Paraneptunicella aestuarii]|uniref:lipoprotein-releasing ABC transporter permease subunit n=1 Tax=Paraneptunicella aestuarii TaxID=2831148 RepID=UPI001E389EFB|nr:lipoprotein-releasing ABC transporter permease subunit [Paraneptunicella aestuarii]UAA40243.1 lipoprotein-releasing ABC transporter permease subunit [Paraneptunicella aestuarii]